MDAKIQNLNRQDLEAVARQTDMTPQKRAFLCIGICLALALVNYPVFRDLLDFSLHNDYSSHIIMVPFISCGLLLRMRSRLSRQSRPSPYHGGIGVLVGVGLLAYAGMAGSGAGELDLLPVRIAAAVILWISVFLGFYGTAGLRTALFPLLFLFFMVPIPETLLNAIVTTLQRGSAEASAALFRLTGTTFFREGLVFSLPGITVEIATQCSGIRSSLALLITCLLAGHLMLHSTWRKLVLVLVAVPMAMIKNAIRIVTLSMLAIHVDPKYLLNSDLHRDGGILFFMLALLLTWPVLWVLRRPERKPAALARAESK